MKSFTCCFGAMALAAWVILTGEAAQGAQTQVIVHETYEDFAAGELESTSLSSRGQLFAAPGKQKACELDANMVLDLAVASDKSRTVYAATADEGYVFAVDGKDRPTTVAKLPEPLVTALAFDADGLLHAAGAPGGNLYKISSTTTTPILFCRTGETYIWSLLPVDGGGFLAATGDDGKILTIDADGTSETLYETDTKNVTGLLRTSDGRLLAITQDKARVYQIDGKDKGHVLYEGKLSEARAIVEDNQGALILALNAGPSTKRFLPSIAAKTLTPKGNSKNSNGDDDKPSLKPSFSSTSKPKPSPGGKAILVKIHPAGFASLLWSAVEGPIHSMALHEDGQSVVVAAGNKGKLFLIEPDGDYSALFQIEESSVLAMEPFGDELLLGATDAATLYRAMGEAASPRTYLSPAVDAGSPVEWGAIRWHGAFQDKRFPKMAFRSGATAQPDDDLWLPWSKDIAVKHGYIQSDDLVNRYLQYRLTFEQQSPRTDWVEKVQLYFVPQNRPPIITSVTVSAPTKGKTPAKISKQGNTPPSPGSNASTMRLLGKKPTNTQVGGARGVLIAPFSNPKKKVIKWQAKDDNNDTLAANVYYRAIDEEDWKLIEEKITKSELSFAVEAIPDGSYRVKVEVYDQLSNVYGKGTTASLVSDCFTIDNGEPFIGKIKQKYRDEGDLEILFNVRDDLSVLSDVQFSLNRTEWKALAPEDGIMDSKKENFSFLLSLTGRGWNTLAILATDEEGNTRMSKTRIPGRKKKTSGASVKE